LVVGPAIVLQDPPVHVVQRPRSFSGSSTSESVSGSSYVSSSDNEELDPTWHPHMA